MMFFSLFQATPGSYEGSDTDSSDSSASSCDEVSDSESIAGEEDPDVWSDIPEDHLLQDITNDEPLPEPRQRQSSIQAVIVILQWFAYFLLFWQAACKISDNGLEWLLRFMFQFLHMIGITCNSEYLSEMVLMFPSSLYLLRKFVMFKRDDFVKFVVCPKCSSLYNLENCTRKVGGKIVSKICSNKPFKKSRECGASLAKKVILSCGKECFYPHKLYCFNSVIDQVERLLKRPGVPEMCEQWREREVNENILADVYDGGIWTDFLKCKGKDFLNVPRNLAFAINVDWFQPFKRRNDRSVGVIYLVLLNLPREQRFKWENIIVAGIVPEMSKEPKSLNTFLAPIVSELQALWKGVKLSTSSSDTPLTYRGALLLASADLPAIRKLCGFKGYSAHRGCSKCFKYFPGSFKEKTDYSGFDRDTWPLRHISSHRRHAEMVRKASTQTKREKLATKYGVYYSCLLQLEYFDAVKCTAIDPMHNLFLGTAKHVFKLWTKKNFLTKKDLKVLEERIHSFDVGTGIGRLPHRIASNYGSYTASQWKNWTLIYSMFCLEGLLPVSHLRCWQTFVLACQYLTSPVISKIDILKADMLFVKFGERFECLYGKNAVTPNMHLHCHLKECIMDCGPVHAFWCFSFERFNGILGSMQVNGRSVEVQMMRKLLAGRFVWDVKFPSEFQENFMPFFAQEKGDFSDHFIVSNATQLFNSARCLNLGDFQWSDLTLVGLPNRFKHFVLDSDELRVLIDCYKTMYPREKIELTSSVARKYSSIMLGTEKFGSKMDCRNLRSARVMASWTTDDGCIDISAPSRPGIVNSYILHSVKINGEFYQHLFAIVWWYKADCDESYFGKPAQVWKLYDYEPCGPALFMPVQRIRQKYACSSVTLNGVNKLVSSPIPRVFH